MSGVVGAQHPELVIEQLPVCGGSAGRVSGLPTPPCEGGAGGEDGEDVWVVGAQHP